MKILTSVAVAGIIMLGGCGSDSATPIVEEELTRAQLGEKLFFDQNLSLTGNTSCATCHNPEHAFIDARFSEDDANQSVFINGAFSVGDDGVSLGGRNAPTASYARFSPDFGEADGVFKGGQFHDGRAENLKGQAGGPPLDGAEMMMPDKGSVVERLKENEIYVKAFKNLYGSEIFSDINRTYESMTEAIAKFEKTDQFTPFDSKYDRMLKGEYTFTNLEDAGYALFFSNANTNCASCHSLNSESERRSNELFTNHEYENIGTPRNVEAMDARAALGLQDANATFLGLGGTVEQDEHLGKTKVPTLRNIAVTAPYMNNGVFKDLRTVLEFYDHMANLGDHPINPETGKSWGATDHPLTVNHDLLQDTKALPDTKIRAIEAFLRTLTDKKYEHLMAELKE